MAKKFAAIALAVAVLVSAAMAQTPAAKPQTQPAAKPVMATVAGKVVNESLKGLAATVTIGSLTAKTNPATGEYTIANVPVGKDPLTLKVEADGYEAKTAAITVSEDNAKAPLVRNFSLKTAAAPAKSAPKKEEPQAKPAEQTVAAKPAPVGVQTYSSGGGHLLAGVQLGVCHLIDSPWHKGGVDQSTSGFVGDLMLGYSFSPVLSLRADIGVGLLGTKDQPWEPNAKDFSTNVIPVTVDVLYRILRKPAFSPYLIVGAGVMPWSNSLSTNVDTLSGRFSKNLKANAIFGAGLGLQYAFSRTFSVFMEGRYSYFGNKAATNGAVDTNNALVRGTVGVAMNLFSRPEEKPALATIKGKITDKALKGLAATIMIGTFSAKTVPATGEYSIANVPVTTLPYAVKAMANGYVDKTSSVLLTKKNVHVPQVINLALDAVPVKPGTVAGSAMDYKTGAPLAARLILNGPKTQTINADAKGLFDLTLDPGNYEILAKADGYNDKTVRFTVKEGEAIKLPVGLVKKKEVFTFENINFDVGKATIRPESEPVLNQLYKVLQDNPEIRVEIAGHTDKMGSPRKNLVLSQGRAAAVVKWMMDKGIKADRMVSQGYGDTKPVADNKTKAGRAKNRRIEIAVLENVAPPTPEKKAEEPKAPVAPSAPAKNDPGMMSLPGMPASGPAAVPVKPDTTKKK